MHMNMSYRSKAPSMAATAPPAPSGLPLLGQTVDFARNVLALYDETAATYGDVARLHVLGLGDFYALMHPDHFERALCTDRVAFAKTEDFDVAFGQMVAATEGERWRRQRDAMDEFFYPARIRSYADDMVTYTRRHVDRWADGDRLSLQDEMGSLALENLFGTLFDRPLDPDGDDTLRRAAHDLNRWFKSTSFVLPRWVPTPARREFAEARRTLAAEARSLLDERERSHGGDDLLSTLVALRNDAETGLADDEIIDQVTGLVFAGHETTALALTYAFHRIGTHEEVRERFHDELETVLDGDRPTLADLGDLTVTERIVQETLRCYPPVHTIPRRTTRDVELDGHRLRAGTRAHLVTWRVHRDERFWDAPTAWRPRRWRDTNPRAKGYAFVPFGAGPRACLGRRFALLEAKLVLATVGQRYRIAPERDLAFDPEMTLQPAHSVPVRVHRRG